jgi:hypothetical protein
MCNFLLRIQRPHSTILVCIEAMGGGLSSPVDESTKRELEDLTKSILGTASQDPEKMGCIFSDSRHQRIGLQVSSASS